MNNKLILTLVASVSVSALAMDRIGPGTDPKTTKIMKEAEKHKQRSRDRSNSEKKRRREERKAHKKFRQAATADRATAWYELTQDETKLLEQLKGYKKTHASYGPKMKVFLNSTGGDTRWVVRAVSTLMHLEDINKTLAERAQTRAENEVLLCERAGGAKDQKGISRRLNHMDLRIGYLKQVNEFMELAQRHAAERKKITDEMGRRTKKREACETQRVNQVIADAYRGMGATPSVKPTADSAGLVGALSTLNVSVKGNGPE